MAYCYKNTSIFAKTFYGVTFNPGEIKEVPGPIHHAKFIRLCEMPKPVAAPKPAAPRGRKPKEKSPEVDEAQVPETPEVEVPADISGEPESITEPNEEISTQEVM